MSHRHRARLSAAALLQQFNARIHATAVPGPAGLSEVGTLGPLPCWSTVLDASDALALARRLARQGQLGLLFARDPQGIRQLLCVTIAPVRPVVVVDGEPHPLAVARLARVVAHDSPLGTALACAAALDVDAAGRRAFRALRAGIAGAITELPAAIPSPERHAWVLLQVTRLLFLRFVEAEGWLDGRQDFLVREFDDCLHRRAHPERALFAPLFFGTLNRPATRRSRRATAFGTIPFLNGGLFEPHPIERRREWTLPTPAWRLLFELIVESFEVTLDRGDVGDRVNPELLGRVFEGVMEPAERKAAGTFYTPTELVPAVLRTTLACHLAHRLQRTEHAVATALDDRDPELDRALLSLRILDPAVGSGAFLVGALALICDARHGTPARVRHVITRRLFGVDRNPAAVRLTELRLWLELLRATRGRPAARLSPLPNLDTTIRAGDALCDPFAGLRLPDRISRQLAIARRRTTGCHGPERRAAVTTLRRVERRAANVALVGRIRVLRDSIADLLDQARGTDLFGSRSALRPDTRLRIVQLRRDLRMVQRERRRMRLDGAAPAFGIESAFAPVLADGGFDLVIGNPPWVRGERLPPRQRAALAGRFRWWRGSGSGWRHSPDLAVAFVERGFELLAPQGTLGFLVPTKLATASYATACRAGLSQHATLHVVADLHDDPRAAFEATTYPLAVIASRRAPTTPHRVRIGLASDTFALQAEWQAANTWSLASEPMQALARRLAHLPTLAESCVASLGVKTGANAAFLDPPAEVRQWTRPAIRGRDVRSLAATSSSRLLWPADQRGAPWRVLPPEVRDWLLPHRAQLERRSDFSSGAWWQLFRVGPATQRWRVIWSDLAPALRAAPLPDAAAVPLNSCYVTALANPTAMAALAAWLNATAIGALARLVAEPAANDHARFGARAVGTVPLPVGVLDDSELARLGRMPWSVDVARAINDRAAHWLALTASEREVVDAFGTTGR